MSAVAYALPARFRRPQIGVEGEGDAHLLVAASERIGRQRYPFNVQACAAG